MVDQKMKPLVSTIVNLMLTMVSLSYGMLIAKCIDKVDNKRNNGYVFTKY